MSERPREFDPTELDRLEDALERLEHEVPEDAEPRVRERMGSYRDLLIESRAALAPEALPPTLARGILAAARAELEAAPAPRPAEPAGGGWFERFRRAWLSPMLALAGSAALVLWILRPDEGGHEGAIARLEAPPSEPRAAAAPAAPGLAPPTEGAPSPTDELQRLGGAKQDDAETPTPAASADEARADPELASRRDARSKTPLPAKKSKSSLDDALGGFAPEPAAPPTGAGAGAGPASERDAGEEAARAEPKAKPKGGTPKDAPSPASSSAPSEKSSGAPIPEQQVPRNEGGSSAALDRGDRLRRGGRCGLAEIEYRKALRERDARVQARAQAGLGLCAEQGGSKTGSSEYFRKARALDPAIDGWIRTERR